MSRSPILTVTLIVAALIAALSYLHLGHRQQGTWGAVSASGFHRGSNTLARSELTVGYLPVTCHLTCPVIDYASKHTTIGTNFNSQLYMDFPSMAEAVKADRLQAAFMIVPLAMKLREEGVPVRICCLGHRVGSTFIVRKSSTAKSIRDLKGRKVGIPSIYSNQYLLIRKMMEDNGMAPSDIAFIVMAPPDMPSALASGSIAGYFVGEPFAAAAQTAGTGRILYNSYDMDPNFVSCALVVRENLIKHDPTVVRDLVHSIYSSGLWADTHRTEAADLAAHYNHQPPSLLRFVLTQPGRVRYDHLTPTDEDMEKIERLAVQQGILAHYLPLNQILDRSFAPDKIAPFHMQYPAAPQQAGS